MICNQPNNNLVTQDNRHASHKEHAQRYATNQTTIRLHKTTNTCHTKHIHKDMQPTKQQSGYTRQQTCFTQNTCIKICNQPKNNQDTQDNRYASHKTHAQRYATNQTTIRLHKTTGMCHIKHIQKDMQQTKQQFGYTRQQACFTQKTYKYMQPTKQQSSYTRQQECVT